MIAKVKESEKSRILITKDYSIFNLRGTKISKKHLNTVKESIIHKNLNKDYPILVDCDYNVIDGKYRFLALYELKESVHYKVAEITEYEDVIRNKGINKNATYEEIADCYSDLEQYNMIIVLSERYNLNLRNVLLEIDQLVKGNNRIYRTYYQSGKLTEWDYKGVEEKIKKVNDLANLCNLYYDDALSLVNRCSDYYECDELDFVYSYKDLINDAKDIKRLDNKIKYIDLYDDCLSKRKFFDDIYLTFKRGLNINSSMSLCIFYQLGIKSKFIKIKEYDLAEYSYNNRNFKTIINTDANDFYERIDNAKLIL